MPIAKGLAIQIFEKGLTHSDLLEVIGKVTVAKYHPADKNETVTLGFVLNIKPKRLIKAGTTHPISEIVSLTMDDKIEELHNDGYCKMMKVKVIYQDREVNATIGTRYVDIKDLFD